MSSQDRSKVGLLLDVQDLDAFFAALDNPPDELADAMKDNTVLPETVAVLIGT